ncbi:MAG: CotH kinase family protein [Crocinitomicaceae bacterium]
MRLGLKAMMFLLLLLAFACQKSDSEKVITERLKLFSDLETITSVSGELRFLTDHHDFTIGNADFVSTDFARSGKQSLKLDEKQVYGLNLKIKNLSPGQFVRASVWQKAGSKDGALLATVSGEGYKHKFRTYNKKFLNEKDGWFQHYLTFTVTEKVNEVQFYVFSGKKEAYFDDFQIEVFPQAPSNQLKKRLHIYMPEASQSQMNAFTSDALGAEIIASKNKKYVKAFIYDGNDSIKVKMKLKGDWTDHLKSGKTSYRIKISGNESFDGLKSFSIQHPKTRNYIHEWILHKIAEQEDVLTTTYSFVNVSINGFDYGVYALEEHFDKQLIESRNRREGPILKLDESGAWALNYKRTFYTNFCNLPYFESSVVSVFKQNRTLKNQRLRKNFLEGSVLLSQFKNGEGDIENIFDIDKLAKFYVLLELTSHDHALAWHNRRFYFNPITQLLEPIIYDAIPHAIKDDFHLNVEKKLLANNSTIEGVFDNRVFLNRKFKERFLFYLTELTSPSYTDAIFKDIDYQLNEFVGAMHSEDESYRFDKTEYYRNAKFIVARIPILDSIWETVMLNKNVVEDWTRVNTYKPAIDSFFVEEISINAYLNQIDSNQFELSMQNFHANDINVIGYSIKKKDSVVYFDKPILLSGYVNQTFIAKKVCQAWPSKLLLKVSNLENEIIEKTIIPYPRPLESTTRTRLKNSFSKQSSFYRVKNNVIEFKGQIIIDELLYIPKEYKVKIYAGSKIEFKNGGGLIVNNNFEALGREDKRISFICKDSSSNGLTIINKGPNKTSGVIIFNTSFSGLSNLDYENWELSGAVNIYESAVLLGNITIKDNDSEDALNIIRSEFKIAQLTISNTLSDGFDADFCKGVISESKFENTGNDCIDFSGSEVEIKDIEIIDSGDKGISGGEKSKLTISNISINGAITGVASKDESLITGADVVIENAEYGFAAFQKKGEYAPAKIVLTNAKWSQVKETNLVGKESELNINGIQTIGSEKLDIDKLYERFEKK